MFHDVLAHLSQLGSLGVYKMVLEPAFVCAVVHVFTSANIFSETTWQIKAKFYMKNMKGEPFYI